MENKIAANVVTLRLSGEGEVFEDFQVEKMVAMESEVIKSVIQDTDDGKEALMFPISCNNIKSGKLLEKVLEYCEYHAHAKSNGISEEDIKIWDTDFAKNVLAADGNQATAYHLLMAADFLEIRGLLDLLCKTVADFLKDKSIEEIRRIFKKENDFTEEEEAAIKRETSWAYDFSF